MANQGELRERKLLDKENDATAASGVEMQRAAAKLETNGAGEQPSSPSAGYAMGDPQSSGGYQKLELTKEEEQLAEDPDRPATRGRCSADMLAWRDEWLHSVEIGELDIYTCMGLSNIYTFSPDTRKIIGKVIGVCVLQIAVPCILLEVELAAGFSFQPKVPGLGFRVMGVCLYLYSLSNMYSNALDECRSRLLQWCIDQNVPAGFWLPMLMGELTNVFVSLILVLTLFVIFVDVVNPADLILNAVAVNFLGAVDGEFVDEEMKNDALRNFKDLFYEFGADEDNDSRKEHRLLATFLTVMLFVIVVSGLALSAVFLLAPSPEHMDHKTIGSKGHMKLI